MLKCYKTKPLDRVGQGQGHVHGRTPGVRPTVTVTMGDTGVSQSVTQADVYTPYKPPLGSSTSLVLSYQYKHYRI